MSAKKDFRGKKFERKNLSNQDFSQAKLQGADFTNADLTGANFHGAYTGLQKHWVIILTITSLILSGLSGIFSVVPVSMYHGIILDYRSNTDDISPGIIILIIIVIFFIDTICKGIVHGTVVVNIATPIALPLIFIGTQLVAKIASESISNYIAISAAILGILPVFAIVVATFAQAIAVSLAIAITKKVFVYIVIADALFFSVIAGIVTLTNLDFPFSYAINWGIPISLFVGLIGSYIAWRSFHQDEKDEWISKIAVAIAAANGTKFENAILTDANFDGATIQNTNFTNAIITRTVWDKAQESNLALWKGTIMEKPAVRDLLVNHEVQKSYEGHNLKGANLNYVNLSNTNFTDVNLCEATLYEAILDGANLTRIKAIDTNFTKAKMTGVILESWNIDKTTLLDEVESNYVYLVEGKKERRPHDCKEIFKPGEFTKLFQKALETVDLIFSDGIDWKAFLTSFEKLQKEYGRDKVSIDSFKNKGETFIIRINVPPGIDKVKMHRQAKRIYQLQKKLNEANEKLNEANADLLDITKKLAGTTRSTSIQVTTTAESKLMSDTFNTKVENSKIGSVASKVQDNARQQVNQYNYTSESKQTLAEAAEEIQKLLKQLEKTNPNATVEQKSTYVNVAISPTLKSRCISALQAGGEIAVEEFLDNPYVNVGKAIVKGWIKPE